MNKILVLMEKPSEGRLNVPIEKLGAYLEDGWKEISRAPMAGFDPAATQDVPAEGGEKKPPETVKERKAREKAEAEAALGGEQKPPEPQTE